MPVFLWFAFEIFGFFFTARTFGFGWALFAYWAPSVVGLLILSSVSRSYFDQFRGQLLRAEVLGGPMLRLGMRIASGVLLVLPFFTTRLLALFLFLPGSAFILLNVVGRWLRRRMERGEVRVFRMEGVPRPPIYEETIRDVWEVKANSPKLSSRGASEDRPHS